MPYADYTFYSKTFGGTKITADKWNYYAGLASDYIDSMTFQKAASVTGENTLMLIKKACCACAESIFNAVQSPNGTVSSERIGDYSVSYASSSASQQEKPMQMSVKRYLAHTGLLYRGVDYAN